MCLWEVFLLTSQDREPYMTDQMKKEGILFALLISGASKEDLQDILRLLKEAADWDEPSVVLPPAEE